MHKMTVKSVPVNKFLILRTDECFLLRLFVLLLFISFYLSIEKQIVYKYTYVRIFVHKNICSIFGLYNTNKRLST